MFSVFFAVISSSFPARVFLNESYKGFSYILNLISNRKTSTIFINCNLKAGMPKKPTSFEASESEDFHR